MNSLVLQKEVEAFIDAVASNLPASPNQMEIYRRAQSADSECSRVKEYCCTGWPNKGNVAQEVIPYWKVRSYLTLQDDLLLKQLSDSYTDLSAKGNSGESPC